MLTATDAPFTGATLGNQPATAPVVPPAETKSGEGAPGRRGPKEVSGTHKGSIDGDQRARRVAKNARTRTHGGQGMHKSCSEYPDCHHPKHGKKA